MHGVKSGWGSYTSWLMLITGVLISHLPGVFPSDSIHYPYIRSTPSRRWFPIRFRLSLIPQLLRQPQRRVEPQSSLRSSDTRRASLVPEERSTWGGAAVPGGLVEVDDGSWWLLTHDSTHDGSSWLIIMMLDHKNHIEWVNHGDSWWIYGDVIMTWCFIIASCKQQGIPTWLASNNGEVDSIG